MSQLLTSLLTVVGVLGMMFWVSPLLALIALVSVPIAMFTTGRVDEALAGPVRRPVAADGRASTRRSRRRSPGTRW